MDKAKLKKSVEQLLEVAFPDKPKDELEAVKEGEIHVLEPGTPEYEAFRAKRPGLAGANWCGKDGKRVRAVLSELDGVEIPEEGAAMIAAHEAGHDLQKDHSDDGLMARPENHPVFALKEMRQAILTPTKKKRT